MNRANFLVFFSVVGFVLSQSIPGISYGPLVVRLQDLVFIILAAYYFLTNEKVILSENSLYIALPLIGIFIYSLLILPIQLFSIGESLFELVELLELIIVLIIFPHLISNGTGDIGRKALETIFILSVMGSIVSIPYYILTGGRFVGVWYIIGLPAIGLFLGVSSYMRSRHWLRLAGILFLITQIILARSRNRWVMLPIATILAIAVSTHLSYDRQTLGIFSRVTASVLLITGAIVVIFQDIATRFQSLISGGQGLFARPARYFAGLLISPNYPLGVGLANYGNAIQESTISVSDYPAWFTDITGTRIVEKQLQGEPGSHSDVFQFLLETGLVGFSLFVLFWVRILRLLINGDDYHYRTGILASIIYIGLQSIINTQLLSGPGVILVVLVSIHVIEGYDIKK